MLVNLPVGSSDNFSYGGSSKTSALKMPFSAKVVANGKTRQGKTMRTTIPSILLTALVLAAGCGNTSPSGTPTDMAGVDQASSQPDMALVFPVPAGCNTAMAATGTAAYSVLSTAGCTGGSCHNISQIPAFSTQTGFMAATINKVSTSGLSYVVPSDPDRSYLLYKLSSNPRLAPGGSGSQMPSGRTPLTAAQMCTIYQWIKNGAPTT